MNIWGIVFVCVHTGKESPNSKDRLEARLFGNHLVFQTIVDIQRVREDDHLLGCDTLSVVEIAHHLYEVPWFA